KIVELALDQELDIRENLGGRRRHGARLELQKKIKRRPRILHAILQRPKKPSSPRWIAGEGCLDQSARFFVFNDPRQNWHNELVRPGKRSKKSIRVIGGRLVILGFSRCEDRPINCNGLVKR